MSDGVNAFIEEIEEDIRRERLEQFWHRYKSLILGAVILVVLTTAAISGWHAWQSRQEELAATALFNALGLEQADVTPKEAADRLSAMAEKFTGTQQAIVARMMEAGMRLRMGDRDSASRIYESIASGGGTAPAFRDLATLFAVELELDKGDPLDLQRRLERLEVPGNPWRFSAWEFGSLLAARRGDTQTASMMLEKILADSDAPAGISDRAREMLRTYPPTAPAQKQP